MSKKLFFVPSIGFFLFTGACATSVTTITTPVPQAERVTTIYDCEHNGTLNAEERRSISLFNNAAKIQIISFSSNVVRSTPIDKNVLVYKYTKETITLSDEQINELTDILYNYNYSDTLTSFGVTRRNCYYPRHAVVFLDSLDKTTGYFEFCFECLNYKSNPSTENAGTFCNGKFDLLADFFKSAGITFFKEAEENEN